MLVPSVFMVGLSGIELPFASAPGIDLRDGLRALTDRTSIERTIGAYEQSLGAVEAAHLRRSAPALVYKRVDIEVDPKQVGESINGALIRTLAAVHNWVASLWLIKDHAVDVDVGWMAARVGTENVVNNNRWSELVCKANGSMSATAFTKADIRAAALIPFSSKFWSESGPISLDIDAARDPATTKLAHGSLRFQRFLYFVQAGRTARDVAIKIAHWCSGLEALVSSSQSELSHQVSERTASALHPPGPERLTTFKLVKLAYGMRSKAVHGAAFKAKDQLQLVDTATRIDEVCRSLARLYLQDASFMDAIESATDVFNDFWLERLLLGDSAPVRTIS